MVQLKINGKPTRLDVDPNTPLLWAVREQAGLTGTKFGCGIAMCGACTVHVDGQPVRLPKLKGRRLRRLRVSLIQTGRFMRFKKRG